jgi:hypothetical protein
MSTRRVFAMAVGLIAAAALGLAAALTSGASAQGASASGSASLSDPAGDANGAPDITTVVISDDAATGMVQFTVTASGEMTIDQVVEPEVNVFIDTDRNPATGTPAGHQFDGSLPGGDYRLSYERSTDAPGGSFFEAWNGTSWKDVTESATMSSSRSGDTFTWRLSKSDLGVTGSDFDFYLTGEIFNADTTDRAVDLAPDNGAWSYTLSSTTTATTTTTTTTTTTSVLKPLIGKPTTTPGKAIAGQRLTVIFPVTRSDAGAPLTSGKMICDPSVQGKVITHAESFKGGIARLSFTIPTNAKGKLLKVKVTIKLGNKSTTRIATFHVS